MIERLVEGNLDMVVGSRLQTDAEDAFRTGHVHGRLHGLFHRAAQGASQGQGPLPPGQGTRINQLV